MTAAKLVALGFSPISLPVSRTVTVPFQIGDQAFDALAVTSANAFRHVPSENLESLKALPLLLLAKAQQGLHKKQAFRL